MKTKGWVGPFAGYALAGLLEHHRDISKSRFSPRARRQIRRGVFAHDTATQDDLLMRTAGKPREVNNMGRFSSYAEGPFTGEKARRLPTC